MAHRQIVKFSLGSFYILTSILLLGLFTTNKPVTAQSFQNDGIVYSARNNESNLTVASFARPIKCDVGRPPC
ncbi:MAG: hypothetical protein ACRC1Z_12290 [Waterburya sp.]